MPKRNPKPTPIRRVLFEGGPLDGKNLPIRREARFHEVSFPHASPIRYVPGQSIGMSEPCSTALYEIDLSGGHDDFGMGRYRGLLNA